MGNDVITRATSWAMEGRRSVKIEIDTQTTGDGPPHVGMWCYDYDLMTGARIMPGDPIPDMHALARERAASLASELETLNQRLEVYHGQTVR